MHPLILLPLVILFIQVYFFLRGWKDSNEEYIIMGTVAFIPFAVAFALTLDSLIIKRYSVEYTTEAITSKIFVHTKYGEFESDKKVDSDEWVKNYPGYIEQHCNAWGHVVKTFFKIEK